MTADATIRIERTKTGKPVIAHKSGQRMDACWDPAETRSLSAHGCRLCFGEGIIWRWKRVVKSYVCVCVLREIFRQCLAHYHICRIGTDSDVLAIRTHISRFGGWSLPNQEYCADFLLLARRTLREVDYLLFRLHCCNGSHWKECARELGIDRAMFFRKLYLVEQRLGYAMHGLKPYALHPIDGYFYGSCRGSK